MASIREQIRSANDIRREAVEVPEWGVTLYCHTITALERERCGAPYDEADDDLERQTKACLFMARIIIASCQDAEGNPVFEEGDESWLVRKSNPAIKRVFAVVARLNALSEAEQEAVRKNSDAAPAVASPTA